MGITIPDSAFCPRRLGLSDANVANQCKAPKPKRYPARVIPIKFSRTCLRYNTLDSETTWEKNRRVWMDRWMLRACVWYADAVMRMSFPVPEAHTQTDRRSGNNRAGPGLSLSAELVCVYVARRSVQPRRRYVCTTQRYCHTYRARRQLYATIQPANLDLTLPWVP